MKYVIPPATVVNQKNGNDPQGVDAHHFTFTVSVTSVYLLSSRRLKAMDFGAGSRERAHGVCRENAREFFLV